MNYIDKKIYEAILFLIKNKKKVSVKAIAHLADVERPSVYYRLNKLQ